MSSFKKNPSGNSVVPVPFSSSHPPPIPDEIVEVGSDIYVISGRSFDEPSSSVPILDCRSHTWRDAPNMTVARECASAIFFDEKIYVMGGFKIDEYPANWIDVFDIKTQSWTALPGPGDDDDKELCDQLRRKYCTILNVFEGKLYVVADEKDYTYDPKDGTWKLVNEQSILLSVAASCVMVNVLYCCTYTGELMWYDPKGRELREIKGLKKLRDHRTRGLKFGDVFDMVNYGGKLLVMWNLHSISAIKRRNKIWYAMISLESRCNGREVWGNVECVDVLKFPGESYEFFDCLIVSV